MEISVVGKRSLSLWLKPISGFKLEKGFVYETEDGVFGEVRTFKTFERIRLTWRESDSESRTVVQLMVHKRPNGKSTIGVQHEKLRDGRQRNRLRAHWKAIMESIIEHF